MHYFLTSILFFMTVFSFAQNTSERKMTPERKAELESALEQMHQDQFFNGALLLAENGKVVFEKTLGIANVETGELLQSNSSYRLASVSKQFIGTAIVILKEAGRVDYEDDIRKFLPELPYEGVTVRHLLHHTGGLPDYMDLFEKYWDIGKMSPDKMIASNEDLVKLFAEQQPEIDFQPGEKYEYSNTGYVLLGSIIERVSKQSIHDFLYENIFQPAGMTNTRAFQPNVDFGIKNRVYGFDQVDEKQTEMNDHNYLNGMVGDGGIYASARDLLAWDQALKTDTLVSAHGLRTAYTSGVLNDGTLTDYGFGWSIKYDENGNVIEVSHGGSWVGFRTYIVRSLQYDQTLILLTNNTDNELWRVVRIAANIWKGEAYKLPEKKIAIELSEAALKQYAGVYEFDPDFSITITVDAGKIFAQATGQGKFELFPSSEHEFFLKVVDASVTFNQDDEGKIESMTLHQGGDETAKKVK
ncbi:MAG: serine hydrolase [Bacteroidota bacterium]